MNDDALMVARAFASDPFYTWLFPREATRVTKTAAVMRLALRRCRRISIDGGIAGWHAPEDEPPRFAWRDLGAVIGLLPSVVGRVGTLRRFARSVEAARPKGHVHLELLAVDPAQQGRGVARKLLEQILSLGPVALETTNPKNIDLYRRFGFEVIAEVREADVPPAWTMTSAGDPSGRRA